jgi:F0F1-type ATP synthase membrane subunit b/b'
MPYLIGVLIGLIVGGAGTWLVLQTAARSVLKQARAESEQLRQNATLEAQNKAKEIELSARQEQLKLKEQFER